VSSQPLSPSSQASVVARFRTGYTEVARGAHEGFMRVFYRKAL
jgi:hypothetical protein